MVLGISGHTLRLVACRFGLSHHGGHGPICHRHGDLRLHYLPRQPVWHHRFPPLLWGGGPVRRNGSGPLPGACFCWQAGATPPQLQPTPACSSAMCTCSCPLTVGSCSFPSLEVGKKPSQVADCTGVASVLTQYYVHSSSGDVSQATATRHSAHLCAGLTAQPRLTWLCCGQRRSELLPHRHPGAAPPAVPAGQDGHLRTHSRGCSGGVGCHLGPGPARPLLLRPPPAGPLWGVLWPGHHHPHRRLC